MYNFFTKKYKDDWSTKPPAFEFAKWKKTEEFFKKGVASGEVTQDDILYIQAFTIPGKPNTMSMNCPEMPPLDFSSTDAVCYTAYPIDIHDTKLTLEKLKEGEYYLKSRRESPLL